VTDEIGKDIFLWNTPLVKSGDPAQIGALLKSGGFESVILKVADGPFKHFVKVNGKWVESVTPETVAGLKAQGLKVFGYGFCYGVNIRGEASIAVAQCRSLKLDGYVFDVEGRFEKQKDCVVRAKDLGERFRAELPDVFAVFCGFAMFKSWKGGTWHNVELHKSMLSWCDAGVPMCYWAGDKGTAAVALLDETLRQWRTITAKPIYPAGRAYNGDAGLASVDGILAFGNHLRDLGIPGESWWVLDQVVNRLPPSIWSALASLSGFLGPAVPPAPTIEERLSAVEKLAHAH